MTVHDLSPSEGGYPWCGGDNHSERQFVFHVTAGLSIQNQSVPGGTIGQPYSVTLTALSVTNTNPVQGSPAAATWTVQSGNLPAGVTLSSQGLLSGTPTTEGSYTFVVRAQAGGVADTETETLDRPPASCRFVPVPEGAAKSEVGVPFTAEQTATGGNGTFTWTLASGSLPAGSSSRPAAAISRAHRPRPGRFAFGRGH